MKTLILYYSFEGNTEFIANEMASQMGADIQKIEPMKELKTKGFYKYIWGGRQAVMKEKPPIQPITCDLQAYDLILIGSPVWAFTFTPPIRTFIDEAKLQGKNIGFFYCHEGGPGKTLDHFKEAIKGNTLVGSYDFVNPLKKDVEQTKLQITKFIADLKI